ncbi:hypothetical protein J2046_006130 [Rhizobium petrolearium]|uniref:hypothetical protein n=1 Tax=Neorhizobium petrolearium TaxID=515361 RepID=UPI001AEA98E1|nr:hypothetical protein [Neorhizobium petrolearium]MBP1847846.1 hypothetical protein [Neorhizobium petrolearium]
MNQEDEFLTAKYIEYRQALSEIERFTPLMPFGWFKSPQTIRLDGEFGLQQMAYGDLASEAARDLANGINHLIVLTMRLEAWGKVIDGLDTEQKFQLLHEFVQDLAATAILSPYTLKARFYFAIAHLSHQANCARQGEGWVDDSTTLPDDRKIKGDEAARLAKPWRAWKKLIRALETVDNADYRTATDDFRSKHTHRFTPRVELGITQPVKRLLAKGEDKPSYGVGGTSPLKLKAVVAELKTQCIRLSKCYGEFRKLVVEQSTALFGNIDD